MDIKYLCLVNKKLDYLIVGQGLAGTFLAFQLLKEKKQFVVVDQGHESSSSMIAAGIINPLVLKRLTITWRADEFLSYNASFFDELEQFLGKQYLFKTPIEKLVASNDEENFWEHRFHKADLEKYIDRKLSLPSSDMSLSGAFKIGKVKQTSWLNISKLLTDFREVLKSRGLLIEKSFDFNAINQDQTYGDISFKRIVFCEGANATKNPFFKDLPFSLNKGQLITISSEELVLRSILKKQVFVLPVGGKRFKVGATYSWRWEDEKPEKEKTETLKKQLSEMLDVPYKIVENVAGVRPAVKDRRPLIGQHKQYKNYFIFNGLGSRGCFMAPLLAKELLDHIEHTKPLHKEVEISRFD